MSSEKCNKMAARTEIWSYYRYMALLRKYGLISPDLSANQITEFTLVMGYIYIYIWPSARSCTLLGNSLCPIEKVVGKLSRGIQKNHQCIHMNKRGRHEIKPMFSCRLLLYNKCNRNMNTPK